MSESSSSSSTAGLSPLEHAAYDFGLREYDALGLSGELTRDTYVVLLNLVERFLAARYPAQPLAARLAAARAGLDLALRDQVPGFQGSEVDVPFELEQPGAITFQSLHTWNTLTHTLGKRGPVHLHAAQHVHAGMANTLRRLPVLS